MGRDTKGVNGLGGPLWIPINKHGSSLRSFLRRRLIRYLLIMNL